MSGSFNEGAEPSPGVVASHITLRVADLARAEAFYVSVLGFARQGGGAPDAGFKALLETTAEPALAMAKVANDALHIELLQAPLPDREQAGGASWHMALRVDDLGQTALRIEAGGGRALGHTRLENAYGRFLMCEDPDGHRLLLIQGPR